MSYFKSLQAIPFVISSFVMGSQVHAAVVPPIPAAGTEGLFAVVTTTDPIFATFQGSVAAFSNNLYLDSPGGPVFLFNNLTAGDAETISLGTFPIGTELLFHLEVTNTGQDYFSGPASRNPDAVFHARIESNWSGGDALIGFEDLFAPLPGAANYQDLNFSLNGVEGLESVPVPVPPAVQLFLLGLFMLFWRAIPGQTKLRG